MLAGALAVLALPPVHLWPVLVPSFSVLVWLLAGSERRRTAFADGWWFGFGYFAAGLYWVANALLTKPEQFGWLAPFAVLGLGALLAFFPAVATLAARWLRLRGVGLVVLLAAMWSVQEWLRSWVLTGFPWNLTASVWAFSDEMLQVTALTGSYGLGLATVAAAAMPAALVRHGPAGRRAWGSVGVAFSILACIWVGGVIRLALSGPSGTVEGVQLRLVQPNIAQNLKWRPELVNSHVRLQAEMGALPGDPPPTHIIWAEAAAPLFIAEDAGRMAFLGHMTPPGGLTILGTLRRTPQDQPFQVWNSLLVIDPTGAVVASYDKFHLVPFGEYIPFRSVFKLPSIAAGFTDFSRGPGLVTLRLPGLPPVGPLICYEVIFPAAVVNRNDRPGWLLNLTNDGWYGVSAGPYQHLVAARLRAVEEGLPLVRVANTGISAIVDGFGRTTASLALGVGGVVDGPLPEALPITPYGRYGNGIPLLLVVILVGLCLVVGRRQ
jgi:apolipoprotein N-acyltransferase